MTTVMRTTCALRRPVRVKQLNMVGRLKRQASTGTASHKIAKGNVKARKASPKSDRPPMIRSFVWFIVLRRPNT